MSDVDTLPSDLEPIDNHILFQFVDEVDRSRRSAFKEQTEWGFQLGTSLDDTTKKCRWGVVIGLGPDAEEEGFYVGQMVLIEALRWTRICEYKGVEFSRTDSNQIVAVAEDD